MPNSSPDTILRISNLSKEYARGERPRLNESFRELLTNLVMSPIKRFKTLSGETADENRFWALKNIEFEVQRGEVVGIIGRNGAGKSTLLKIISRITDPTEGRIEISGRVASLLEIGTGFHHELTGRENIFLNGAILGMTRKEIKRKFDEIVAFSEVEDFLDTPVKRYSSGMFMRLAFSVAAHLEPELLLIDEVLAVGDTEFQQKCIGKMDSIAKEGRTVLFVSHNLAAIQTLCSRAILLQDGRVSKSGSVDACISAYLQEGERAGAQKLSLENVRRINCTQEVIKEIWFEKNEGQFISELPADSEFSICIRYAFQRTISNPVFEIRFSSVDGRNVATFNNYFSGEVLDSPKAEGVVQIRFDSLPLISGDYHLSLCVLESGYSPIDTINQAVLVHVLPKDIFKSGHIPSIHHGFTYLKASMTVK